MIRYCTCGQPLLLKPRWTGRSSVVRYYDATKPAYQPESIFLCPRCGVVLHHEILESRPIWLRPCRTPIEPGNPGRSGRAG